LRIRSARGLRSLQNRNFRLFFAGHSISIIGTWMQRVAQDWLVLEITGSAVAVGVAFSLQFVPTLVFGLYSGVLVDRFDRRRILLVTQAASAALAALLALLVLTDAVELWMVNALALALGFVTVVDTPTRQAFVAELVGPTSYVNGQALASTVHNGGRLVGPALAGVVIASYGAGVAFAVNALSFVAVLWGLILITPGDLREAPRARREPGQVREGLRYVHGHPELRACVFLVAVIALFGQNFRVVLPVLAQETFHGGAETYGWLTSALGVGAVAGALATAWSERVSSWALLLSAIGFGVTSVLAGIAPLLTLALLAMVMVGVANIVFNTLARTLLQLATDRSMHGRVMALHSFVFLGTTPIGAPVLGWVCEQWGPRAGLVVGGGTALLGAAVVWPQLRTVRPARPNALDE
jgi:MFS family permease